MNGLIHGWSAVIVDDEGQPYQMWGFFADRARAVEVAAQKLVDLGHRSPSRTRYQATAMRASHGLYMPQGVGIKQNLPAEPLYDTIAYATGRKRWS